MKRIFTSILSVVLVVGLMPSLAFAGPTDESARVSQTSLIPANIQLLQEVVLSPQALQGTGTEADPYLITTAADLQELATNVKGGTTYSGSYFKLTANLDLSAISNWAPIGTQQYPFQGSFDGNNCELSKLTVSTNTDQGVFGYVGTSAVVKNLKVTDSNITSTQGAGGIAAHNSGIIQNCAFEGTVTGQNNAGGIVAASEGGSIVDCTVKATVGLSGTGGPAHGAGGIVGYALGTSDQWVNISGCEVQQESAVQGSSYLGGIVGTCCYCTVAECANHGQLASRTSSSMSHAGGIAGSARYSADMANKEKVTSIERCYNDGIIAGGTILINAGGIAGETTGLIENCYNLGSIAGSNYLGGIVGITYGSNAGVVKSYNAGQVTPAYSGYTGSVVGYQLDASANAAFVGMEACYYLEGTYTRGHGFGDDPATSDIVCQTTCLVADALAERQNYVGWDFANIWVMDMDAATSDPVRPVLRAFNIPTAHVHDNPLEHNEYQEVTCEYSGNDEYWFCGGCTMYFSDAEATEEIVDVTGLFYDPLGHVDDGGVVTKPATTTAPGEITHTCTRCGKVLEELTEVIPQLPPEKVKRPTTRNFVYDGKRHVAVTAATGYHLSGDSAATKVGTYRVSAILEPGYAWEDGTQYSITLRWEITQPAGVSMMRLYSPYTSEHLYTSDTAERDNLVSLGWRDEGLGWIAPSISDTPVYRVYSIWTGDHHYTTDAAERDNLVSLGWQDEGLGWYSADATTGMSNWQANPLYRMYAPFLRVGQHHYTVEASEADFLANNNWLAEGVGWYAMSVS